MYDRQMGSSAKEAVVETASEGAVHPPDHERARDPAADQRTASHLLREWTRDGGAAEGDKGGHLSPKVLANLRGELQKFVPGDEATQQRIIDQLARLNFPSNVTLLVANDDQSVIRAVRGLHDVLKREFNVTSGDANADLAIVATDPQANCIGSAQLFLATARALGLAARPIEVVRTADGRTTLHVASMVALPSGKQATADLLFPDAVSAPFDLGGTYQSNGKYLDTKSAEHYRRIRELSDQGLRSFVEMGKTGNGVDAASAARRAIELDPDNAWAHQKLGADNAQALAAEKAPGAATQRGDAGMAAEARSSFDRAIALRPEMREAYRDRATLSQAEGAPRKALADHTRYLAMLEAEFKEVYGMAPTATTAEVAARMHDLRTGSEPMVVEFVSYTIELASMLIDAGDRDGARRSLGWASTASRSQFEYYQGTSYEELLAKPVPAK